MGLVHLLLKRPSKLFAVSLFIVLLNGITMSATVKAEESKHKAKSAPIPTTIHYDDFDTLRSFILEEISKSKSRFWLATEFLTDGEVASALYIAKYRRVDVKVLIGRPKARHYLSRLNYLKSQQIPVYIMPRHNMFGSKTVFFTDESVYAINSDLDHTRSHKTYTASSITDKHSQEYFQTFIKGFGQELPALPRQMPLVGTPRNHPDTSRKPANSNGTYIYDNYRQKRPAHIPATLPKQPLYEKNKNP